MNNLLATMCYIDNGDSYLMLKRNKKENDIHEGLTISVGGKFEIGESPEDCVIREVKEETNLDIIKPKLMYLQQKIIQVTLQKIAMKEI